MREVFISHIRPILNYASVVWFTGYLGDVRLLEAVQSKWTKKIIGFCDVLPYRDRLAQLSHYSIRGRLIRADLIMVFKSLKGLCPNLDHLMTRNHNRDTRGHSCKLYVPRCNTDVRACFFSLRVINIWNTLPDSVVSVTSVNSFKNQLGKHLGQILYEFD